MVVNIVLHFLQDITIGGNLVKDTRELYFLQLLVNLSYLKKLNLGKK